MCRVRPAPEGRYQGGGADRRDAEELLGIVAGVRARGRAFRVAR